MARCRRNEHRLLTPHRDKEELRNFLSAPTPSTVFLLVLVLAACARTASASPPSALAPSSIQTASLRDEADDDGDDLAEVEPPTAEAESLLNRGGSSHPLYAFTQARYTASIPENSLGKVLVTPDDKMGILVNDSAVNVRFRIRSGDPEDFFKAEAERVGDFIFLVLRTRTSNLNQNVLNRERTPYYDLDVRAKFKSGKKKSSAALSIPDARAVVRVEVVDVNDLDPFFAPSRYEFSVTEDSPLHASIGRVRAEDADAGINAEVYYNLVGEELSSSSFAVDPVTGAISLTRPLSFKERPRFDLRVAAKDRGPKSRFASTQPDTATVSIRVEQVNQNDPVINIQHLPEVIEQSNADIYAIVRVTDPDSGRHGEIASLEIIEGDPEAHFRVRPTSDKEFNIEVLHLLDREIAPFGYNLTLKAVDRGTPPRTAYKNVHVQLADVNDHSPVFSSEVYEVRVNESAPINTPIVRLKVSDEDSGRNARVKLSIAAGNEQGVFRIDPVSGVLFVARPLDAEAKALYTLTVSALDSANFGMRKQSSAKVRVLVNDVNDNDPIFEGGFKKEVYFNENEPAGTQVVHVVATDADSGENGYVSYSLVNADAADLPFEIDHFTGVVKSTRLIDYESDRREYRMLIRASDWGLPYRRQSELRLTVRLRDINDNRPQFERVECRGDLPRDTTPGASILTLSALDFDAGDVIAYRIVSGNADGCFSLDASKGVISVVCDLRTLPMRSRELNVTATDGQHFSDVTPVLFRLVSADERRHSGSTVRVYSARGTDDSLFDCRDTGVAKRLTDMLAEAEKNNRLLPVETQDDGDFGRFGTNLHQPEFDRMRMPREIRVNETAAPGTVVLKVLAQDRDLGFNGNLLYVISEGDRDSVFRMDTETGELTVDGILDRETTADYMLNITAYDQGQPQKSASWMLHVIIEDVNDNSPVWVKSAFSFFFPENTRSGTPVVTLNASDPDSGDNGKVTYVLDTDTDAFALNPITGLLVVSKELDREAREYYDLVVRAVDGSRTHPLSSTAVVRVRVLDVNDNAPTFTARSYLVKVREDFPKGTVIGSVNAVDQDLYQGGKVRYSIVKGADNDDRFVIDEVSGVIRIKKRLDYEHRQLYNLTIHAQDEGAPPLSSTTAFVVEVIDVNENLHAPQFGNVFLKTSVPENLPSGSHVVTVSAKDLDDENSDDSRVSYSVRGGDGIGSFFVDADGNIRTLAMLDRESKSSYWLTVYAQDHGAVPLASKLYVYVEVLNVNDNVPLTLEPIYHASVSELSKPFTHVISLSAEDADADPKPSKLTYEIVAGNPQSLFHIDSNTGIISTTKRLLDRETQAEHVLEVLVNDNGQPPLNSTSRVVIAVQDVNDNAPEFLERSYKLEIPEVILDAELQNDQESLEESGLNSSEASKTEDSAETKGFEDLFENSTWESLVDVADKGKPIFRVLARDKDYGDNGRILYSLKSGPNRDRVNIDPETGVVYATGSIVAGMRFDMLARASDSAQKPLSSITRISVTVGKLALDSQNAPKISEIPPAQVLESDDVGHLVALVMADDPDGDPVWYSITAGDDDQEFYMSPDRGSILLARKLSRRKKQSYNLTVCATDGTFKAYSYVIVSVIGSNEVRPTFVQPKFEVEVAENTSIGNQVIKMNVSELEEGRRVFFSFHSAQDPLSLTAFRIDPTDGAVYIRDRLDYERIQRHVFTVAVKDQAAPAKADFAQLVITVHDHNDHPPSFLTNLIQTKLHETADIGTQVVEVLAVDTDRGDNGRISYSIASGNIGNAFSIDGDLGIVRVARRLDMTVQSEYMLMVRAFDHGETPLSSTVPVHITLTMADDAAPVFSKNHYATEVYENVERGHPVLVVEARSRSALTYEIVSGNEDAAFYINPSAGIIMTQRSLDFEEVRYYNLTVRVSNTVGIKAECSVSIHVLDVNDNSPRFERMRFSGHVAESASVGSLVLTENEHTPLVLKAIDEDTGVNSLLQYEIMDEAGRRHFAIDDSTGAVRILTTLDYEVRSRYEFYVRVSDRGNPRLSADSMTLVNITVDDENDSPPRFEKSDYRELLLLPTFKDVEIVKVRAHDLDLGIRSQLRYSIVGGNDDARFRIDPLSGVVRVVKEEEVGLSTHYAIDVAVSDGKFSDRCIVYVTVEKSDNSGLVFAKSRYSASVLENTTKSEVIAVVTVLGAALNENLRFSLLNPSELFEIGATSGALRTTGKAFDREEVANYELVVEVRSVDRLRAIPRVAHTIVEVKVLDLNDNAPVFINQPFHAVVPKNGSKDEPIIRVTAIDRDEGPNGDIYYQLVKGNGELFRVGRKTGQVSLRQPLDGHHKEHRLTVAAYDGGAPPFSAEANVLIRVIDSSVPVFSQQIYTAAVREDVEPNTAVITVEAESPSAEAATAAAMLIYTIEAGNEEEQFSVDYSTGVLSVTDSLDFERKPHHQLTVRATDSASGGYAEAIVLIGVEDVNDCRPQFKNDSYVAFISEAMPFGTHVVTVQATDADSGINKDIEYGFAREQKNVSDHFVINSETGEVSLRRSLDFERSQVHHLTVVATDKGLRPLSSSVIITVNVVDQNDNAPEFEESEYSWRLSRASRGKFLGKVRAVDPDEVDAGRLQYDIIGGNDHQTFAIDEKTGAVTIVNMHDFNSATSYLLNVSVSDGVFSSTSRVRISLLSANLFAPKFERSSFEVDFPENQPEGTLIYRVTATDEDRGDRIRYSMQSDAMSQLFNLDEYSGEIWSLKSFDREQLAETSDGSYEIPITATDTSGRNGFTTLKVRVTDENDNGPVFSLFEYKANIYANTSVGSAVVKVVANDDDDKFNSALTYSIYENKTSEVRKLFDIDAATGEITLKKNALELKNQAYQFFVRAQDGGRVPLHADAPVEIYIMSPLDKPPVFEPRDNVYYVHENSPVGRVVASVTAATGEEESTVRYKLVSTEYQGEDSLFVVDEEGRVIINGILDREKTSAHHLTVLAETDSSPTLNTYYDFTIQVLDENDNVPEFQSNPYKAFVSESTPPLTSIVQAQALDRDFGNNGEVRYGLGERSQHLANLFHVDIHNGWITTQGALDYEAQKAYELHVVAVDNGNPKLTATTFVQVEVVDANDNPQKFSQRHYSAAVNEGALPGTIIFQLETEDRDEEAKTEVEFFVTKGDPRGQFQVKRNGELYVSRRLDRETTAVYKLEVVASDGTFVTTCRVTIDILDDNDSPPICARGHYKEAVSESAAPGTYLVSIKASDADEGINAKQAFYLTGQDSELFSIDRDTGMIKTLHPLDRERSANHVFLAHAQDAGVPEWECISQVEITVLDTNDNSPAWAQSVFSASIKEDVSVGTIVAKVHATDADSGDNRKLRYAIADSASLDHETFKIDAISGIVSLAKPVDREIKAMYNLTLRATDNGKPKLTSSSNLVVLVLDINDNPPVFVSKMYSASVSENTAVGANVVHVQATSKDTGVNAEVTYSIVAGNEHRKFKINPKSGVIVVSGELDHEKGREYLLTIQAQDGGDPPLSNHASVNITVLDENDNAPAFSQGSYSATVNEAASVGHSIAVVSATDPDSGENGRVNFAIVSGDRHKQFSIDAGSGHIRVASALDREMVSNYVLEVQAFDHGRPKALTSTVLVNVEVLDANDSPPVFPEGNYTAYLSEGKPLDSILLRFTVTDADETPNGSPFTFDIRGGNEDNSFRVVQDGTLRTAAKFNHKIKNKYELKVRVFDSGAPPLWSDAVVTVNIIEESQYPPVIVPLDISIFSYQDDFPGAVIGSIVASDQDPYDQLQFDIVTATGAAFGQSNLFEVDHSKGTLIALEGLDVGSYNLNVSVSDGKFISYSSARVQVEIITDEMLRSALIVRFASLSPKQFVLLHEKNFVKMVKTLMNVRNKDVVILSVQPVAQQDRNRRSAEKQQKSEEIEVLFVVRKSKEDFVARDKLRAAIEPKMSSLAADFGLKLVDVQQDLCLQTENVCQNGECRDSISMEDGKRGILTIASDSTSFVSPHFRHETVCKCKEGFAGDVCEIVLNECAREPCPSFKICVPDTSPLGYSCRCPEGMTGALCNVNVTHCRNKKCDIVNPMSFNGKSYAQFSIIRSFERHLSVSLGIKTLHSSGNLMYAVGLVDYSVLEIVNGKLRYRFNFGSGEGLVTLDGVRINDGIWHDISLERHGNNAKISVDGGLFEEQGSAPGFNDVLNLEDGDIYFGAEVTVHRSPTNGEDVSRGFVGCLDDIRVDGIPLPLHLNGESPVARLKRLANVEFKCGELTAPGPCGSHPCQNGGTCIETAEGGFTCSCPARFTNANCEYDLDPCASGPCLFGGKCVGLKNDFHCECPAGLSGKRCHYGRYCNPNPCLNGGVCEEGVAGPICKCRGFTGEYCTIDVNECLHQNPCQNGGTCVNTNGAFHCLCPPGMYGLYCNEDSKRDYELGASDRRDYALKLEEVVGIISSLFLIVLLVIFFILCRNMRKMKQRRSATNFGGANRNSASYHIQNEFDKQEAIVLNHNRREKLNNLELAGQERPLLSPPRPLSFLQTQYQLPPQQETSFNFMDPVRNYGPAGEDLETLPRIPHDYIQSIQKPMAAVAPSVCQPPMVGPSGEAGVGGLRGACALGAADRNFMDSYFQPVKAKGDLPHGRLRVNLPPRDSPALKPGNSLSSLPASMAEDASQPYYWDSFDLNNDHCQQQQPLLRPSLAAAAHMDAQEPPMTATSTLPPPLKRPVDPTRDIETLNEDDVRDDGRDAVSTADTEDEPQLGPVSPNLHMQPQGMTKSFEELLALNDDIHYVDDEGEEMPNSYDYRMHINSYLPAHNISETDTADEQTPMMPRHAVAKPFEQDTVSSISALPENGSLLNGSKVPSLSNGGGAAAASVANGSENICEIEDSDDENCDTPTVDVKPMPLLSGNPRVTRV